MSDTVPVPELATPTEQNDTPTNQEEMSNTVTPTEKNDTQTDTPPVLPTDQLGTPSKVMTDIPIMNDMHYQPVHYDPRNVDQLNFGSEPLYSTNASDPNSFFHAPNLAHDAANNGVNDGSNGGYMQQHQFY